MQQPGEMGDGAMGCGQHKPPESITDGRPGVSQELDGSPAG